MANNASNGYSPDPDLFAFTKDLIRSAREEAKLSGASDGPAKELQPGATIDLGHRNIHELPDNVVELMKTEIERSEFYLLASTERPVDPMNLSHPQYRAVQPLCCYLARDHVSVERVQLIYKGETLTILELGLRLHTICYPPFHLL